MNPPSELLTLQEAADAIGKNYRVIYRLVSAGRIPTTKIGQRRKIDAAWLPMIRKVVASLKRGRPRKG